MTDLNVIERKRLTGKVYFLRAGDFVKIGFTKGAIADRIAALQTGCPFPIKFIGAVDGGSWLESRLHQELKDSRVCGEWFQVTPKLLAYVSVFFGEPA